MSGLDFSGLDNIAVEQARSDFKPASKIEGNNTTNWLEAPKTATEKPQSEAIENSAKIRLDYEQERATKTLEVYAAYQSNIRRSASIPLQILKGIQNGEDVYRLLLKACDAISLMTNDAVFYKEVEENIIAIHGLGFLKPAPLGAEREATAERLERLRVAYGRTDIDPSRKQRIKQGIDAHESYIKTLSELIDRANS